VRSIHIPLIVLLLQGIPEQIAVVTLACVIARIPLEVKKIIAIGTIMAVCAYVVRLFPIPFGVHTIIINIILFIALIWLSKGDLSLSIIACFLSILALAVSEFVCFKLIMHVFGMTNEALSELLSANMDIRTMLTESGVLMLLVKRIAIAEPQVLLLFVSAFLLNKFIKKRGQQRG
jgi:hypothetical protein